MEYICKQALDQDDIITFDWSKRVKPETTWG